MRETDRTVRCCLGCGSVLDEDSKFCGVCGTPVPPRQVGFCGFCGAAVMEGQEACYSCGSKVAAETPATPAKTKKENKPKKEKKPQKKLGTGAWMGILAVLLLAIIAVTVALLFQPKVAESVSLDRESLALVCGSRATLEYEVLPENVPDKSVTWSTSDPTVATVKNGEVVAVGAGTCRITATAAEGVYAVCTVKVVAEEVRELALSHDDLGMYVGDAVELLCQIMPKDAPANLTWSSDNETVAVVDKGTVTAVGVGECVITVTTDNKVSASCKISVAARNEERLALGTWKLIRIDDRFAETSHRASGCTLVLKMDLTGTMTQDGVTQTFTWRYATVDGEGDCWYDTQGMEDDTVQIVYSAGADELSLYGTDETWVFTR